MSNHIRNRKILFLVLIISLILFIGCNQEAKIESYDYPPIIYWNNQLYIIQDLSRINITKEDLNEKIGEVSEVLNPEQKPSTNGVANEFEVGSVIYSLSNEDKKEAIVIEFQSKYYIGYSVEKDK